MLCPIIRKSVSPESPACAGWGGLTHGILDWISQQLGVPSPRSLQLGEGGVPVREEHGRMSRGILPEAPV